MERFKKVESHPDKQSYLPSRMKIMPRVDLFGRVPSIAQTPSSSPFSGKFKHAVSYGTDALPVDILDTGND